MSKKGKFSQSKVQLERRSQWRENSGGPAGPKLHHWCLVVRGGHGGHKTSFKQPILDVKKGFSSTLKMS